MRKAKVYYKGEEAGILIQNDDGKFTFKYIDDWINNSDKPPICFAFSKFDTEYYSDYLFPFFYNMIPEGTNKQVICRHMRIDENDYFSLLITTACYDTIGAVTVKKIEETE